MNSYNNFKVKNSLVQYLYYVTENIICNIYFYFVHMVVLPNLVAAEFASQASECKV